jgi:hypothetical protein
MTFHFIFELVSCICMLVLGRIRSRGKNLYFKFIVGQGKWSIPLKGIIHIVFKLPCHVVSTQYD